MKNSRGFTLIELMVVVVVIAILAAVALPSYRSSVMKSRRSSAQAALLDLASREERYYTANNTYASDLPTLGYPAGSTTVAVPDSNNYFYDLAAPTLTKDAGGAVTGFKLQAAPANSQTKDTTCGTYTFTSLGLRGNQDSSGTALTSCWN
ncbi:type IV pilin protein [Paraherbaspirillum soli]|uniref:Type IV pilin protein n=1 Tax=Paraherbaspirillum soli TaxID=631222 RepID=A0ABW0M8A8_9BURK